MARTTCSVHVIGVGGLYSRCSLFSRQRFQVRTSTNRIGRPTVTKERHPRRARRPKSKSPRQRPSRPVCRCRRCTSKGSFAKRRRPSRHPESGSSQDRAVDSSPSTASPNVAAEPTSAASTARPGNVATSGTLPNVAGSWRLKTQVESSSYSRYAGLQLGYEIRLDQKGDRVTGSGRKITENGNEINPSGQTPLSLSGTISGDRLTLNFVERGELALNPREIRADSGRGWTAAGTILEHCGEVFRSRRS